MEKDAQRIVANCDGNITRLSCSAKTRYGCTSVFGHVVAKATEMSTHRLRSVKSKSIGSSSSFSSSTVDKSRNSLPARFEANDWISRSGGERTS